MPPSAGRAETRTGRAAHTCDLDTAPSWDRDDSLFRFTRGRLLYDERNQMAQRTVLSTPTPKVLAWDSRAERNAVGAEYIIMEEVEDVSFSQSLG